MKKRMHVFVSGKVQNVNFRSTVKSLAEEHKVQGWVKNRGTDQVEAIFEGDDHAVQKLITFCHDGPELAEVEAIMIDEEQYTGEFSNFDVQ